jgi:hypothetical protein
MGLLAAPSAIPLHTGFPFCGFKYFLELNYPEKLTHGKDLIMLRYGLRTTLFFPVARLCLQGLQDSWHHLHEALPHVG